MYEVQVDPKSVLPWHNSNPSPDLERIAQQGLLEETACPVVVCELPEQYRGFGALNGALYVVVDGHHRREAAIMVGVELPAAVLEYVGDLRLFPELTDVDPGTAKYWRNATQEDFERYTQGLADTAIRRLNGQNQE